MLRSTGFSPLRFTANGEARPFAVGGSDPMRSSGGQEPLIMGAFESRILMIACAVNIAPAVQDSRNPLSLIGILKEDVKQTDNDMSHE